MRKVLAFILISLLAMPLYGSSQWTKTAPAGGSYITDLDANIATVNNEALDRLLTNYREDCRVIPDGANSIKVLAGELAIPNIDGSVVRWRKNTTVTSVDWTNIDDAADDDIVSKQYYVWALGDADAATFTISVSLSSSAPDSATYYRLIGFFYNDSFGNITSVGSINGSLKVEGTSDITTTSSSYDDMTDMVAYFRSSGRPLEISFTAPMTHSSASYNSYCIIDIDGTDYNFAMFNVANPAAPILVHIEDLVNGLTAGVRTIKIQWKTTGGTLSQEGATQGNRVLILEEK